MEPAARLAPAPQHADPVPPAPLGGLLVEIVVPVHNEAATLEPSIDALRGYLDRSFPFRTVVTIADNGSTDATPLLAQRLAATRPGVHALLLTRKGRGHALRTAWTASKADVVAYMDVDLSTSLAALLPLVGSVVSGHSDLAVGTRLSRCSQVVRGPKRELISRAYSHIVRLSLRSRVSDFQCGFKAMGRDQAARLLPMVHDDQWFFDTELIVTAERLGLRVVETPVEWTDDPDSSVDIVATAAEDLRGVWRLARRSGDDRRASTRATEAPATTDQLLSFAGVGLLSTLAYLVLFALGWSTLGPYGANAAALGACVLGNTALHRSLTGRTRTVAAPGRRAPSFAVVVTVLYGVSLAATSFAIAVAGALAGSTLVLDALAATAASCVAALARFALLRGWAFPPPPAATTRPPLGDGPATGLP